MQQFLQSKFSWFQVQQLKTTQL